MCKSNFFIWLTRLFYVLIFVYFLFGFCFPPAFAVSFAPRNLSARTARLMRNEQDQPRLRIRKRGRTQREDGREEERSISNARWIVRMKENIKLYRMITEALNFSSAHTRNSYIREKQKYGGRKRKKRRKCSFRADKTNLNRLSMSLNFLCGTTEKNAVDNWFLVPAVAPLRFHVPHLSASSEKRKQTSEKEEPPRMRWSMQLQHALLFSLFSSRFHYRREWVGANRN